MDAEFDLFRGFWGWYKAHHEPGEGQGWWDELIKSGADFWAKYEGTELEGLARDLVMVACNECDRKEKRRKGAKKG